MEHKYKNNAKCCVVGVGNKEDMQLREDIKATLEANYNVIVKIVPITYTGDIKDVERN